MMVGQTLIKTGVIDVKEPSTATFGRGFRFKPWKTSQVNLLQNESGVYELQVYKDDELNRVYPLENIDDVTMCGSKTHAHAFELISGGKSLVIMSGQTELESRDWIWTLKKLFWPHALVQGDLQDGFSIMLLPGVDTDRLNLSSGIYDMTVSLVALRIDFRSVCNHGDSRSTPVQPFDEKESVQSLSIPLTHIAQFRIEQQGERTALVLETNPDHEFGKGTLIFEQVNDDSVSPTMDSVLDTIKAVIFRATTNLHDCIAGTRWQLN